MSRGKTRSTEGLTVVKGLIHSWYVIREQFTFVDSKRLIVNLVRRTRSIWTHPLPGFWMLLNCLDFNDFLWSIVWQLQQYSPVKEATTCLSVCMSLYSNIYIYILGWMAVTSAFWLVLEVLQTIQEQALQVLPTLVQISQRNFNAEPLDEVEQTLPLNTQRSHSAYLCTLQLTSPMDGSLGIIFAQQKLSLKIWDLTKTCSNNKKSILGWDDLCFFRVLLVKVAKSILLFFVNGCSGLNICGFLSMPSPSPPSLEVSISVR